MSHYDDLYEIEEFDMDDIDEPEITSANDLTIEQIDAIIEALQAMRKSKLS